MADKKLDLQLTDDQAGHLAYIMASPAWTDTLEPLLRGMEKGYIESLLQPPATRPDQSDDFLRAGILFVRTFLEYPTNQLEDKRSRDISDQMAEKENEHYQNRADGMPAWSSKGPWDKDFPPEEDY